VPRLRRVDCSDPGIRRRRRGRGWEYIDPDGNRIVDADALQRIRALVIPPAWKDVWICPLPNGHIQAVGIDDAGRKQYLYHDTWRKRRDAEKFDRMIDFARRLPAVRHVCLTNLTLDGMPRARSLACATRLLDLGFFRIGTESYAEDNGTFGLATMLKRHVAAKDSLVTFDFPGKNGKRRVQSVVDPPVLETIRLLKARRGGGPELLAFKQGRRWVDVKAADINDFIKEQFGEDFSAKDFRTWNATVLAAVGLAISPAGATSRSARKRAEARATKEVAHYLGNTPAVSRSSYIDPRVFDRFRSGWTISGALEAIGEDATFGQPSTQGAVETAVIDLLEDNRRAPGVERLERIA
jgi:DNA topoisomerase I